jgi:phosphate-selective porin OprO/OprP
MHRQRRVFLAGLCALAYCLVPIGAISAQQVDLEKLLQRLEKLEQKNEHLEKQNQSLQLQMQQLKTVPITNAEQPTDLPAATVSKIAAEYLRQKDREAKVAEPAGKEFEVGKNLKMQASWSNGLWMESADKAFRFSVGGTAQFDMGWYGASQTMVNSIGQFNNYVDPGRALSDGMDFRRARIRFAGNLWEQIEFFAQYDFASGLDLRPRTLGINGAGVPQTEFDPGEGVTFNEVYIGFVNLPYIGTVRVGRHRESVNFANATQDRNLVFLERPLLFDAFNGDFNFSNGVTVQQTWLDQRIYGYLGFFQNNNRNFSAVGDGEYAYDARLTALPFWDEEEQLWVHVGADYSYRNLHQNQVRFRDRPLVRTGSGFQVPNILNTGTIFSNDAEQIANLEFASAWGRWTLTAEAATSWVTNAYTGGLPGADGKLPTGVKSRGTYLAQAAYVEALCFLTPDHRNYKKDRPGYDRVSPRRPFYWLKGENGNIFSSGAWEVGLRYDYVDLTNAGINGGTGQALTAGLNWYLNPNTRVQWNYFWMHREFASSDNPGRLDGPLQGFGMRFNVDF